MVRAVRMALTSSGRPGQGCHVAPSSRLRQSPAPRMAANQGGGFPPPTAKARTTAADATLPLATSGLPSAPQTVIGPAGAIGLRGASRVAAPSASDEERQHRKRRLLKGPKEFQDLRRNRQGK